VTEGQVIYEVLVLVLLSLKDQKQTSREYSKIQSCVAYRVSLWQASPLGELERKVTSRATGMNNGKAALSMEPWLVLRNPGIHRDRAGGSQMLPWGGLTVPPWEKTRKGQKPQVQSLHGQPA
jgi:hypothetical protein